MALADAIVQPRAENSPPNCFPRHSNTAEQPAPIEQTMPGQGTVKATPAALSCKSSGGAIVAAESRTPAAIMATLSFISALTPLQESWPSMFHRAVDGAIGPLGRATQWASGW